MLIYELLRRGIVFLTAPQGFGKSVNLDMVKRFLEIEVDENGEPKNVNKTSNYDLFVKNNLHITKSKSFFNKHFGKYPTMYIDYSGLCGTTNFNSLLVKLRNVQRDTFLRYKYLLKNSKIFISDGERKRFSEYMYNNHTIKDDNVRLGFIWLSELLFKHFNKRVFVLIDEFDTFLNGLPKKILLEEDISAFVFGINSELLKGNKYVARALIMGLTSVIDEDISVHPNNIVKNLYYQFFWVYFGITENELEELLPKLVNDVDEREKLKNAFDEDARKIKSTFGRKQESDYVGTVTKTTVYKLYSFTPLVEFFKNKTKLNSKSEYC